MAVVLEMSVYGYKDARKIRKAIADMRGVESVSASPEQGRVVVYGTADAWALRRRLKRKMGRSVAIVSDGSAPYYYPGTTHYGPSHYEYPSQAYGYGWGAAPPQQHAYYSQPPPQHAYYSQPPAPAGSYSYPYAAGGGYGAGWADPDPYGYAAHSTVPTCSIL